MEIKISAKSINNTFKHELSEKERERLKGEKLRNDFSRMDEIKRDINGSVIFSKPHTEREKMHVDLIDGVGHKGGK